MFGAYIGKVNPGSPAQKAGLNVGDIITELNLRPVANAGDVELALANIRPGGTAHLIFQRGNRVQRTQISF
ncbi:MAG: PDZ domain-containing protein [Dehalococcoidia bacterium]|nr:PDZ domain-containing protein [Dehalococcoidia bacterium]